MTVKHNMTADEMSAAKSRTAPIPGCRIVGRAWYRWHDGREEWFRLSPAMVKSIVADHAAREEQAVLEAAARTMPWQTFVCHYVAMKTASVSVEGHSIRRVDGEDAWELLFNGIAQFRPMTARVAYSWFERFPLVALSREADDIRYQAHKRAA